MRINGKLVWDQIVSRCSWLHLLHEMLLELHVFHILKPKRTETRTNIDFMNKQQGKRNRCRDSEGGNA
jgi:hypothetical protein